MLTSNKSDAPPRSRQSSTDSPSTDPPSPASTSGTWNPQCVDNYPDGSMHSPEQRHRTYFGKRSSVFRSRVRSNTAASAMSTTPSVMSLNALNMAHADTSRPGSPLPFRSNGYQGQAELSGSRKSLFRGRKGKRLSDSVSSGIVMKEYQEMDMGDKRTSVLRKGKKRDNQHEAPFRGLKERISSPFGFQHLTHTDRHQVAAFEQSLGGKLAAGLQVHTSQLQSDDPNGTGAHDLHFVNFSSENIGAQEYRSPSAVSFRSPPQSPQKLNESYSPIASTQEQGFIPTLRHSRSVESFSQPGVNLRNHRHSQSVLAPPRLSSLPPLAPIDDDVTEEVPQSGRTSYGRSRSKRESGIWDTFSLATATTEPHLPGIRDDSIYVGHALTTPDDTAILAMTPPPSFSPSLDDVAEEPERFIRPRPAPQPPMRTPTTPKSPYFDSSIFKNQRSPAARLRTRGNSHTSPRSYSQRDLTSRPTSQTSDTLGSPEPGRRGPVRRSYSNRRQSNTWRVPEDSWEDDIDYAYEHAMEADCEFDWDRASGGGDDGSPHDVHRQKGQEKVHTAHRNAQQPPAALQPAFEPSLRYDERDFRASLLVPSPVGVPELEPTSAASASTLDTGLTTPCDPFNNTSASAAGGFLLNPSLLVPRDYKEDLEHTYEDLLDEYNDSERHFHLVDPRHSATSSARSRRSSYDSSLMSSAQSSGMWSSPVRRSASSAGSVPELVPSRRNRRDVTFSLMIDQLTDSVASLSHLDEDQEDSDVTPPGRVLENRTFFPAEEESEEPVASRRSIENELRASLELARRGSQRVERSSMALEAISSLDLSRDNSQRSTHIPARHHKQAMSDSGAKLLVTSSTPTEGHSPKPRSRAATTQPARSPMLSLFPAPPRYSPTPNRL
ncbi:hypothetical protein CC86DRAFT_297603 [Ophiobolus disseminans]|uniref:CRIB domain-containing protein n=1 Tax=Ophiobolus disseminans TaxID=1469910 RepID=A0A6A6ZUN0_9PLEO|nr:hypothetical protein CC86DRAFT_297603 [Ophiobolus disseminans]